MAMTCLSLPPPSPSLLSITKSKSKSKSRHSSLITHNLALPFTSLSTPLRPKSTIHFHKIHQRKTLFWRIFATQEETLPLETATAPLESTQQIVSTSDDGTGNIISVLLFIAFVVLSILTIGVIYLGVTDFLGKREKEKFEKEEATKKKDGKKRKVRARAGPRGFGQKINEDDDLID